MRPIATDGWSVALSVMTLSPVKTAEPIEMPFEMLTRVDQRCGPDPLMGRGTFEE